MQAPELSHDPLLHPKPRVAFVHDWLNGMRGGEYVLEELCAIWPLADVHTLFYEPHRISAAINHRRIIPSPLQKLPLTRRYYRQLLPFFPWAMCRMDLRGNDLVISVSHCAAKAAPVPAGTPHVCYCLTPARYFYDQAETYFGKGGGPGAWLRQKILDRLRRWDQETASGVTRFIAISRFVAERIRQVYGREADVVYPPVATDFFTLPEPGAKRGDFFLTVSAAVPYKRLDVVIDAFNACGKPLLVVGSGPDLGKLRRRARSNVAFRPWVGRRELRDLYRRARGFVFTAEEDFGLAPVEAQACGCPVIAYGRGGARETVVAGENGVGCGLPHHSGVVAGEKIAVGQTGVFFEERNPDSLLACLEKFRPEDFDPAVLRANAERFSLARFREEFIRSVRRTVEGA